MADNKVVYQRVRWEMRLASDNSWARHRSKHVNWRSRWIIFRVHLNREWQFHAKSKGVFIATQLNWTSWKQRTAKSVVFLFMTSRPTNWVNWVTTFIDRWQLFTLWTSIWVELSSVELCRYKHPLTSWPMPFWLVLLTEHKDIRRDERGLPLPSCRTIVPVSWLLFSWLSMLPSFQSLSGNSLNALRAPYCFNI